MRGYVDTDMASHIRDWVEDKAPNVTKISVKESATLSLEVIHKARIENAVSFYAYDGSTLPW